MLIKLLRHDILKGKLERYKEFVVDKKKVTVCPDCGEAMVRASKIASWVYRGKRIEYDQPGLYCTACENVHLSDEDAEVGEGQMHSFREKVDASLRPT